MITEPPKSAGSVRKESPIHNQLASASRQRFSSSPKTTLDAIRQEGTMGDDSDMNRGRQGKSFQGPSKAKSSRAGELLLAIVFFTSLYIFFCSIDLMSGAFKLMGGGFVSNLLGSVNEPLTGLLIGLLATSLVQSSSSTTSIAVGLVAAGVIPLDVGIPIVMGANIGTTVTNTIVSLGHLTNRNEFERAFAAGTVHDFFNIMAVLVLFPIEVYYHPIQQCATYLASAFYGAAGVTFMSPLKAIVKPVTEFMKHLIPHGLALLGIALLFLFLALSQMVRVMRSLIMTRVEGLFDRVLFRNDFSGFVLGWFLTALVQSSSATTSLLVPLVGSGVLTVRRIFTYTLGANLGTTVTAILASFATGNSIGLTIAFAHMLFNIFGIVLFYPLRSLPINLALLIGRFASQSNRHVVAVISLYVMAYIVPILYIIYH